MLDIPVVESYPHLAAQRLVRRGRKFPHNSINCLTIFHMVLMRAGHYFCGNFVFIFYLNAALCALPRKPNHAVLDSGCALRDEILCDCHVGFSDCEHVAQLQLQLRLPGLRSVRIGACRA